MATARTLMADARRDPATLRIAKRVDLTVDDDVARGRERMSAALHAMYGDDLGDDLIDVAVVGTPAAVAAGRREVVDAGAPLVVLHPLFDEAEQLERLAAEVLPAI